MAIITRELAKVFLQITGTESDALIDALIPEIEGHYLEIRNAEFEVDEDGNTVYPEGSKLTAAQMIGHRLSAKTGGMQSESLGDYSYTLAQSAGAYPETIVGQIRRHIRVK